MRYVFTASTLGGPGYRVHNNTEEKLARVEVTDKAADQLGLDEALRQALIASPFDPALFTSVTPTRGGPFNYLGVEIVTEE